MKKLSKMLECICWGIFILFVSHKLFADSIRYDEAVEWYVSKSNFNNMYNLIISTFQPPLYNVVMHFWLLVNDSSEWFRIFNIVCEVLGGIALYKSVKVITHEKVWGYITLAISLCCCSLLYYNQICGEYPLVLCCIAWCIYFFVNCMDHFNPKDLLLWVFFCVLSMYTQYGAFIPIVSMAIVLFLALLQDKNWRMLKQFMIYCSVAAVIAGGFLIKFFLIIQMQHQEAATGLELSIDRLIKEPFEALQFLIYAFSTRHHYRNVVMGALLTFVVFCMLLSKKEGISGFWNRKLTWHFVACIITWFIYCLSTWTGIYGYGVFGSRHTIICLPFLIYTATVAIWIFYSLLMSCELNNMLKNVCKCSLLVVLSINIYNSYEYIDNHWSYEQDDRAYEIWCDNVNEKTATYVYWYCTPQFMYYHGISADNFYQYRMEGNERIENILFPKFSEDIGYDGFEEYFLEKYGELQDRYIFIYSHDGNEIDNVMHLFKDKGYTENVLLNENATKVFLFERNDNG